VSESSFTAALVSRPKPQLPPTRRAVSDFFRSALGGDAHVRAYYDEPERYVVSVVEAAHTPSPTLATYATASLHAVPNVMDGHDIRVELLMVAKEGEDAAANVVATAAFCVIKNGWLAAPGVVFPNAVREYLPETTVPHLMWTEPFEPPAPKRHDRGWEGHVTQRNPELTHVFGQDPM
jgi:antitoxin YqcF